MVYIYFKVVLHGSHDEMFELNGSQQFTCQVKEKEQYILFTLCESLKSTFNRVVFPAVPRVELDGAALKFSTLRTSCLFLGSQLLRS